MMKSFHDIMVKASEGKKGRVVVAGAEGRSVIEAIGEAQKNGLVVPILTGDESKIKFLADEAGLDWKEIEIHHCSDEISAAEKAVSIVSNDDAEALMKGKVSTPVLLKAVLNKKYTLRTERLLSHAAILEVPSYHKLLLITDGGMVIQPDIEQKKSILNNALDLMRRLGVEMPKAAVLAAIEKVNPDMPETEHAAELAECALNGEFGPCIVEGPIAIDVAFSRVAAEAKGIESKIAGDPDILIMPNISAGNIFAKGLWHLANAKIGGLVLGARKPIILLSRSDDTETKLNSIALGGVVG